MINAVYTSLPESDRKRFISDVIDLCLYDEERFPKLLELVKESQESGLSKRITIDNTFSENVNDK